MDGGGDDKNLESTAPKPSDGGNISGGGDGPSIVNETPTADVDDKTRAVINQTPDFVWGFMREFSQVRQESAAAEPQQQRFRHSGTQTTDDLAEFENIPPSTRKMVIPYFLEVAPSQDGRTRELVHNMRRIAEDMEQTYRPSVVVLVNRWLLDLRVENGGGPLTFDSVWIAFRRVMNAVLSTGVTWGKLLLLLLFAYEIAVTLYVEHVPGFIREVIHHFVRFLIESPVVKWIAEHGGWAAAVSALSMESVRRQIRAVAPFVAYLVGLGAMALGTYLFLKRK